MKLQPIFLDCGEKKTLTQRRQDAKAQSGERWNNPARCNSDRHGPARETFFPRVFAPLRLGVKIPAVSGQNGSLPLFRPPAYFNPMIRKATGLLPGLSQTAVWLNAC